MEVGPSCDPAFEVAGVEFDAEALLEPPEALAAALAEDIAGAEEVGALEEVLDVVLDELDDECRETTMRARMMIPATTATTTRPEEFLRGAAGTAGFAAIGVAGLGVVEIVVTEGRVIRGADFLAAAFFAGAFFVTAFFTAVFFATVFFATAFLAGDFFAAVFLAVFLAVFFTATYVLLD
jgi:hypothetical protein